MFTSQIKYGTLVGGSTQGVPAFTIELTGDEASDEEIADTLIALRRHKKSSLSAVQLRGVFTKENNVSLMTLVQSLKNSKYIIAAITEGNTYFQWMKDCHQVTAQTSNPEWIGFPVNEIWYELEEDSSPEISLPEDLEVKPRLYLLPSTNCTNAGIMKFLKQGKYQWTIQLEQMTSIEEAVSVGTE